jgi:S1-C subfamily serine protease
LTVDQQPEEERPEPIAPDAQPAAPDSTEPAEASADEPDVAENPTATAHQSAPEFASDIALPPWPNPTAYLQPPIGAAAYGQSPYGESPYGQPSFGPASYGPASYGPAAYGPGHPASYGQAYGSGSSGWAPPGYPPPGPYLGGRTPEASRGRRVRRGMIAAAVAAVLAASGVAAGAYALGRSGRGTVIAGGSAGSSPNGYGQYPFGGTGGSGESGGTGNSNPFGNNGPFNPFGNSSSGSTGAKATAAQQVGVVDINTILKYQGASAAGTGMILDASGDVLTNNHVIDGATSISVTVVSTGKSYVAKVVGTDAKDDIAVIKMQNASGLTTARYGDSSTVKVGDAVTGVGNAGGTGGTPSSASGKVRALNKTITASDDNGQNSETLHGVIVTDAPIEPGDSGGPLYDANGAIVGVDAAANQTGSAEGFAIPINHALALAHEIESGVQTSAIHIGYPAFLAVTVVPTTGGGAEIQSVLAGGPAAKAGITAGDVITKVGSTVVTSSDQLQTAIRKHSPGQRVAIQFTDPAGQSHHVSVTLETGPAD